MPNGTAEKITDSSIDELESLVLDEFMELEGGLNEDPREPGGQTFKGLSQGLLDLRREQKGLPPVDVSTLSDEEIRGELSDEFFVSSGASRFPDQPEVASALFDASANIGGTDFVKSLQGQLGVAQDGIVGPKTEKAIRDFIKLHGQFGIVRMGNILRARRAQKLTDPDLLPGVLNRFRKIEDRIRASTNR